MEEEKHCSRLNSSLKRLALHQIVLTAVFTLNNRSNAVSFIKMQFVASVHDKSGSSCNLVGLCQKPEFCFFVVFFPVLGCTVCILKQKCSFCCISVQDTVTAFICYVKSTVSEAFVLVASHVQTSFLGSSVQFGGGFKTCWNLDHILWLALVLLDMLTCCN